jgi:hypothetical protein
MSTKIYNGYRLQCTLEQLDKRMRTFRKAIKETGEFVFNDLVAHMAANVIDRLALKLPIHPCLYEDRYIGKQFSALNLAYMHAHTEALKASKASFCDPIFDFTCEVVVFLHRKKLYAMLFTDQRKFRNLWEALPWVYPFTYYDNTDHPEDMTAKQWEARGRLWDKLLWNKDIPSLSGCTFSCFSTPSCQLPTTIEKAVELVPTYNRRVQFFVNELLEQEYTAVIKKQKLKWSEAAYKKWMASNSKKKEALEKKIQAKLKRKLTQKDFLRKYRASLLHGPGGPSAAAK